MLSSFSRSSVMGIQMSPLACFAMKFIVSGVIFCAAQIRSPSFSRSSLSVTIKGLPSFRSFIASSIVAYFVCVIRTTIFLF